MPRVTWDAHTLYGKPAVGTCEISGAYETGRYFRKEDGSPILVGNTAAPEAVEDYVGFLTALGSVSDFKSSDAKRDRISARLVVKKKKR